MHNLMTVNSKKFTRTARLSYTSTNRPICGFDSRRSRCTFSNISSQTKRSPLLQFENKMLEAVILLCLHHHYTQFLFPLRREKRIPKNNTKQRSRRPTILDQCELLHFITIFSQTKNLKQGNL